jgi:hypothetical protein
MQPEPIETSSDFIPSNASEPINASQYGIRPGEPHTGARESREGILPAESTPARISIQGRASGDARVQEELRRLNLPTKSATPPKPSFLRISEYENALSPLPPRKQGEGLGFKIIKRKGNSLEGPQLDSFPNGVPHPF